jgi:hypothetical protein
MATQMSAFTGQEMIRVVSHLRHSARLYGTRTKPYGGTLGKVYTKVQVTVARVRGRPLHVCGVYSVMQYPFDWQLLIQRTRMSVLPVIFPDNPRLVDSHVNFTAIILWSAVVGILPLRYHVQHGRTTTEAYPSGLPELPV